MRRAPVRMLRAPLLCLGLLVLAGCATSQPEPGHREPVGPASTTTGEPTGEDRAAGEAAPPQDAPEVRPSSDAATLALIQQSEQAARAGDLDRALAYAERAVRIAPRQADLWIRLARLELGRKNPQTAIRYAQKALSLTGERTDGQRDAWLVIASAREALGEHDTAAAIRQRWQRESR